MTFKTMNGKEDEVWEKVFEILEWSGKNIIPFAGCDALVRNVKEFVSVGSENVEALKVLKEENIELKKEKRILEQEVFSLKTRLEDGKKVEGRHKRKLKVNEEVTKKKLLKLAESFCDKDELDKEESGAKIHGDNQEEEESQSAASQPQKRTIPKNRKKSKTSNPQANTKSVRNPPPQPEQAQAKEISHPSQSHRSPLAFKNRTIVNDEDVGESSTMGETFGGVSDSNQLVLSVTAHNPTESMLPPKTVAHGLQPFFEWITEYALTRLMDDPRVGEVIPNLMAFIVDNITVNESSLETLRRLFKTVRYIVQNPNVKWEQHITAVTQCILRFANAKISDQGQDGYWGLRDNAAKLLVKICKKHGNEGCNSELKTSLASVMGNEDASLESIYGVITALADLGNDVIKCDIIPQVCVVGDRIKQFRDLRDAPASDRLAAEKLEDLIVRVVGPTVMTMRRPPDRVKDYNEEFSYLGDSLRKHIITLRRRARRDRSKLTDLDAKSSTTLNTSRYNLREQEYTSLYKACFL